MLSEMIMCANAEASEVQNMQDMDGGKRRKGETGKLEGISLFFFSFF